MIYGSRFKTLFPEDALVDSWIDVWHDGLRGITGEQMKYGLDLSSRNHADFPPTLPQFKQCCMAMPKVSLPPPKQHWESTPGHAEKKMAKIREMMSHPRPPGKWWAHEILAKIARGESVSTVSEEFARQALKHEPAEEIGE